MNNLKVITNPNTDGWGPDEFDEDTVSTCLDSINKIPFEPKLKVDKQIHLCDFTFGPFQIQRNVRDIIRITRLTSTLFDEEVQFQTVDSRTLIKTKPTIHYKKKSLPKQTTQAFNQKVMEEEQLQFSKQKQFPEIRRQKFLIKSRSLRLPSRYHPINEWSVEPTPAWTVVAEVPFSLLLRTEMDSSQVISQDIFWRGKLGIYDKRYDQVNSKAEVCLQHLSNSFDYYWTSTHDDDCIADILLETYKSSQSQSYDDDYQNDSNGTEDSFFSYESDGRYSSIPFESEPEFFDLSSRVRRDFLKYDKIVLAATDQILAVLMTAARSKYSWHLNVTKIENQIILDKANGSIIDMLTVNETSPDPPQIDSELKVNRPAALRYEAVRVNQNLRQQVLLQYEYAEEYEDPPFVEETDNPATIAYRYRKFMIPGTSGPNFERLPIMVITRCEVHAKLQGTDTLAYICALNEIPNKNNKTWRSQIETQKGALLANEIRNNTTKLQRFVACANLAGCTLFKLGYVTRKTPIDGENHSILGIHTHTTDNLALQMGFSLDNAWAALRLIVHLIVRKPDGQYVLLKDPLKPIIRLYAITDDDDLNSVLLGDLK